MCADIAKSKTISMYYFYNVQKFCKVNIRPIHFFDMWTDIAKCTLHPRNFKFWSAQRHHLEYKIMTGTTQQHGQMHIMSMYFSEICSDIAVCTLKTQIFCSVQGHCQIHTFHPHFLTCGQILPDAYTNDALFVHGCCHFGHTIFALILKRAQWLPSALIIHALFLKHKQK